MAIKRGTVGGIFICYRRRDAAWAGRLSDALKSSFGRLTIFRDIEDIPPGVEFDKHISQAVSNCDALIAIIGPDWASIRDKSGKRKLDNPNDFVRLEIAAALKRNVRLIPILVAGGTMPAPEDLPEDLQPLARRQAYDLTDAYWTENCSRLFKGLKPIVRQDSRLGWYGAAGLGLLAVAVGGYMWIARPNDFASRNDRTQVAATDQMKSGEREAAEKAAAEKAAAEKAAAEKAAAEKAAAEKAAAEKAAAEKAAAEKAAAEKAAAEKAAPKAAAEKVITQKALVAKAESPKNALPTTSLPAPIVSRNTPDAQDTISMASGTWDGEYAYPSRANRPPVPFTMVISVAGVHIEGSLTEPNTFDDKGISHLRAAVTGTVEGTNVRLLKKYDGTGGYNHSVSYIGVYDPTSKRLSGEWTVRSANGEVLIGKFFARLRDR